jgi:hypothetical protein
MYETEIATLTAWGLSYRVTDGRLYTLARTELFGRVTTHWFDVSEFTSAQLYDWARSQANENAHNRDNLQ